MTVANTIDRVIILAKTVQFFTSKNKKKIVCLLSERSAITHKTAVDNNSSFTGYQGVVTAVLALPMADLNPSPHCAPLRIWADF